MSNPIHTIAFLLITFFWGGSFLGIKIAVGALPPFYCAFLRVFTAFAIVLVYLLVKEKKIERPAVWLPAMVSGFFSMGISWVFLFWGETQIPSGLAAILNGTTPFFTAIFLPWILPQDKLTWKKMIGVALGFLGVLIIFAPEISLDFSNQLKGMIAILLMAACYGISVTMIRKISRRIRNLHSLFYQSLGGMLILLPATLFFEMPLQPDLFPAWKPYFAILYLGIFSTALAWLLFFKLVKECGSIQATATTYCIPLVAILLDVIWWKKWVEWHQAAGAAVILAAVFLIHSREKSLAPATGTISS